MKQIKGTEKQIKWAEKIREDFCDGIKSAVYTIRENVDRLPAGMKEKMINIGFAEIEKWQDDFLSEENAGIWIDRYYGTTAHDEVKKILAGLDKS